MFMSKMSTPTQDIAYFISFCIEQYKHLHHLSGEEAMEHLQHYGVLQYLANNYEVLHTQSAQWILEDMDEFIAIRKKQEL